MAFLESEMTRNNNQAALIIREFAFNRSKKKYSRIHEMRGIK